MIGTRLQNYYIEALLGEGGMGRVYKATDTVLGRQVAIKSLNVSLTHQPLFLERFQNEAKILARLTHPNIAVLYNYIKENDDYYMVMEYVEGEDLDELTKQNAALPYQVVVPVMLQALEGLEHAHKKGVLHRDIKPANLMLTPERQVKLMDFGIARVSDHVKLTQASRVIGTLEFLAPELIEGHEPAPASDIYAAGVTMYEMLTGKLPFTGKSDYMLMQEIVKEQPVAPVSLSGTVPEALSEIILKALEKKPENRFQTAAAFSTALQTAFPELKTIPSAFGDKVKRPGPAARPLQATVVAGTPAATRLYKESPATQLADNNIKRAPALSSLLKSKLVYIAAAVLLVAAFAMFRAFTPAPEIKSSGGIVQDTTTLAQSGAEDNITTVDNTISEDHTNDDSVNFILNKKKQEEQQKVLTVKQPDKRVDKAPVSKKPEQKIVQQVQNTEAPKPNPTPSRPEEEDDDDTGGIVAGEPIKLRGRGLPVVLLLQESINKQTAKEGQQVSFKVVEPAMLKGTVVIPSGAVISGAIKGLGSHRMSIIFNAVNAKGKKMRLERSEAGASMANVFSGNTFRINLRGILTP